MAETEESMKILLPVDDSKFSQAAIDAVIAQATPRETEVRIVHALEPIYTHGYTLGYVPDASQILKQQREYANGLLVRASQKLCDKGFTGTTALEVGNPKVLIIDSPSEWHADLIVVGSQGRKGLEHFLLGSVSELLLVMRVVRYRSCDFEAKVDT
jgi:nucleotide-binding universal stress UspA family protein